MSGHTAWQKAPRVERVWKRGAFQARQTTLASLLGSETSVGLRWSELAAPPPSGLVVGGDRVCPCVREAARAHVLLPLTAPMGSSPPLHRGISWARWHLSLEVRGEGEREGQFFLLLLTTSCPSLLLPWTSPERARTQQSSSWRSNRVLAESKHPQCKQFSETRVLGIWPAVLTPGLDSGVSRPCGAWRGG